MTEENNHDTEQENSQQAAERQFVVQKIYIKDVSFEAPNMPELFNQEYKPEVKMELNSKSRPLDNDHYEVVLNVTLSAKLEKKTAFLAEVEQAGLFLVKGFSDQQRHQLLGAAAPESLYPYVRETVASLIGKSGFPAIQLAPINFMGLYMERVNQQQQEKLKQQSAASETLQ